MPDPLTAFPATIRQGDSLFVQVALDDYLASDDWTLTWYLSGPTSELSKEATTADTDEFLLELTPAETAELGVETLGYVAKAENVDGDIYTVLSGTVQILPDLATSGPIDLRSHAQKVLDAIKASLEGRATKDEQEYTIKDRSLKRMSLDELLKFKALYEKEVALETRTGQRNILVNFVGPT